MYPWGRQKLQNATCYDPYNTPLASSTFIHLIKRIKNTQVIKIGPCTELVHVITTFVYLLITIVNKFLSAFATRQQVALIVMKSIIMTVFKHSKIVRATHQEVALFVILSTMALYLSESCRNFT